MILLKRILRIGIYQLIYMQKVPDHAAVNETVKLTRVDSRTEHFSGIVNAVMRALINNKKTITLPDPQRDLVERLSVEFFSSTVDDRAMVEELGLSKTRSC
jgi:16S rRNA (cytosine967-C5)-methyltransferase